MNDAAAAKPQRLDTVAYDNALVAKFVIATLIWGIVGFLVGLVVAAQLVMPALNLDIPWLGNGRLRPLHTNAVIFAFAGNAIFAGVYYSSQRLLKARLFSDFLGKAHFWSWQLIIVLAAITLPLGLTTSKEYAELEWPIDLLIALSWVAFGINLIGTLFKRREKHLYVALWFYIATWIAVTLLHLVNSAQIPVTLTKSYSLYAGIQDALVQWWYGHNAVAFFLTTPFLGLLYYFLPKATGKPIFSYRLSILHFWSLIFIYIWAGPHHLLNSSTPEWAQSLGVMFSVMLIVPSWGGALNGFMTMKGCGARIRTEPILWFWIASITSYTITTFEGCMLSLRDINALSHNTDWTIGHVHNGALGWVGMMVFAIFYWLVPRMWKTELWSTRLAKVHFWLAATGLVGYVVALWIAGIVQGVMQLSFTETGHLQTKSFLDVVHATIPWHWVRLGAGFIYFTGMVLCAYNLLRTIRAAPKVADDVVEVAPLPVLAPHPGEEPSPWHAWVERSPLAMLVLAAVVLSIGSVVEIVPHLVQGALTPTISTVKPYTPLELHGRDLYIKEGCSGCHTQLVRTLRAETERYGAYTMPGEHIYDRPFLWGSKRTGPDLAREGLIRPSAAWQYAHLVDPQKVSPGSIMPRYPWLARDDMDLSTLVRKLDVLAGAPLYTPYTPAEVAGAVDLALTQAKPIADELRKQPDLADARDLEKKDIVAVIAYLQRLGTDLGKEPPQEKP